MMKEKHMMKIYIHAGSFEKRRRVHGWLRLRVLSLTEYHGTVKAVRVAATLWLHELPKIAKKEQNGWSPRK